MSVAAARMLTASRVVARALELINSDPERARRGLALLRGQLVVWSAEAEDELENASEGIVAAALLATDEAGLLFVDTLAVGGDE